MLINQINEMTSRRIRVIALTCLAGCGLLLQAVFTSISSAAAVDAPLPTMQVSAQFINSVMDSPAAIWDVNITSSAQPLMDNVGVTATLASSSPSTPAVAIASVTQPTGGSGQAVVRLTAQSPGYANFKISAPGYQDFKFVTIYVNRILPNCTTPLVTPCIQDASITTSGGVVTQLSSLSMTDNGQSQSAGLDPLLTPVGSTLSVTFNEGIVSSPRTYLATSGGEIQSFTITQDADLNQIVRITTVTKPYSYVNDHGGFPTCYTSSCPENLVATDDTVRNGVTLMNSTGMLSSDFNGAWLSSNASVLDFSAFTGDFKFKVAAPHFTSTCPANASHIALDPAACAGSIYYGFYSIFLPAAALANVYHLPGITAAEFQAKMLVKDSTNGGVPANITQNAIATDLNGGILVRIPNITFSSHAVTISAAPIVSPVVVPPSSGDTSSGGVSGGSPEPATVTTVVAPIVVSTPGASPPESIAPVIVPSVIQNPTQINPQQMASYTATQIASVPPAIFAQLKPTSIGAITPTQADNLTPAQLSFITPAGAAKIKVATLVALDPVQLAGLRPAAVAQLAPAAIKALSGDQLAGLRPTAVASISPATIASMSNTQLKALTDAQVKAMTKRQLALLKPSQRKALGR